MATPKNPIPAPPGPTAPPDVKPGVSETEGDLGNDEPDVSTSMVTDPEVVSLILALYVAMLKNQDKLLREGGVPVRPVISPESHLLLSKIVEENGGAEGLRG